MSICRLTSARVRSPIRSTRWFWLRASAIARSMPTMVALPSATAAAVRASSNACSSAFAPVWAIRASDHVNATVIVLAP